MLDALNVGMLMMSRRAAEVERAVMEFVTRYGLFGADDRPAHHAGLYGL